MLFLEINDDCIEHVFRFLDKISMCAVSEACKRFKLIAEIFFKKQHNYKCHIGNEENIKNACKITRKIGKYVRELHLEFDPIDPALYVENGIGCRFLSLLNRSLGDQFCELQLSGEISSFVAPLLRLAPTLLKLQKLSIFFEYGDDNRYERNIGVHIDLPQFCPNLRFLNIENCAVHFAPNTIKKFKNLEVFEFHSYGTYHHIDSFYSFLSQNTQLRILHVDHLVGDDSFPYIDLAVVTKHLKELEELRIRSYMFDNCVQGVRNLSEQHHLTTLVLSEYVDDDGDFDEILQILKTMTQLKKIWIGWSMPDVVPNQQAIVNIAKELKHLESFQIDAKCDENTIIECVRFGRSLKRFCIEFRSDRVVTSAFIKRLAKVRESIADAGHQPLSLYFSGTKLTKVILKLLKEPDVARYLKWKVFREVGEEPYERFSTSE